ncbi:MAG TPA: ParB/RepB/Spo0J family partition protein [Verrucomicrobiae bacterium]|nr:ParB/RepB/Spo0J family partition protein [Verrucomicrobiae bacterium]
MASDKKQKKATAPKSNQSSQNSTLSKFEKWTAVEVSRSEIKNAPYNPRTISDDARKKLKRNIETVGLVQPIIWNVRTGNCLGGHQRLAILDALEGSESYRLTVARVDLDDKTEKEQNIFLNNAGSQGDWDLEKLAEMFREDGLSADNTGFDMAELYQLFGDSPFQEQPEELAALGERVRQAREQYLGLVNRKVATDDVDFYAVLIFEGNAGREELAKELGLSDNKFLDGKRILEIVREWRAIKSQLPTESGAKAGNGVLKDVTVGTAEPA